MTISKYFGQPQEMSGKSSRFSASDRLGLVRNARDKPLFEPHHRRPEQQLCKLNTHHQRNQLSPVHLSRPSSHPKSQASASYNRKNVRHGYRRLFGVLVSAHVEFTSLDEISLESSSNHTRDMRLISKPH